MSYPDFWTFYAFTVCILWVFLLAISAYRANPARLRRAGMREEYVRFLRSDIVKRGIGIGIVIPMLLLASAGIVWLFTGDLDRPDRLISISLLFIVLVIPFPIFDTMQLNRKYRELAMATGSETVVDLSYRTLHLVFNPAWEALAAAAYLAFFWAFVEPFHVAFVHLLLLWFLYAAARSGRYLTQPMLKEGYVYVFVFLMLNQGFLLYHLVNVSARQAACDGCGSRSALAAGAVLGTLLAAKLVWYLSRYPRFTRALSG